MTKSVVSWLTLVCFFAYSDVRAENPHAGAAKPIVIAKPDVIAKPTKPADPVAAYRPAATSAIPLAYTRTNDAIITRLPLTKLPPAKIIPNLCLLTYRITTDAPECQAHFDQGLGYYYS